MPFPPGSLSEATHLAGQTLSHVGGVGPRATLSLLLAIIRC